MKSFLTALAFCAAIGVSVAQTTTPAASSDSVVKNPAFRKNNVKINLSSLAVKNFNLSYERSLARKLSLVAGYSVMPTSNLGDMGIAKKIAEQFLNVQDPEVQDILDNATFGSRALTGEVRYYMGKHDGPRGFYVAAYGRQTNMTMDYLDIYEPMLGQDIPLPYKGKLSGFGGGLMVGAQWLITNRLTFDWYIAGGHYGKLGGDINVEQDFSRLSETEKRDLEAEAEERFTVGGKQLLDVTITNSGAHGKVDGPFFGARAFGFNVGYAF